jgi:hypothetical protein
MAAEALSGFSYIETFRKIGFSSRSHERMKRPKIMTKIIL